MFEISRAVAVPLDGVAAALEELADRDGQGEPGDGRDRGQQADREGRPAEAGDEDRQERGRRVDDAHRDRIPAHDPGVVDRVRAGRPAGPEPRQRDRGAGQGGRAAGAQAHRRSVPAARVTASGRSPSVDGPMRSGRADVRSAVIIGATRGDDGILGRVPGRRDARNGLSRPAPAGPDGARARPAAGPAARRRLLGRSRSPIWRADLFTEVGGAGPYDAAHYHPTFDGLTPCERVGDPTDRAAIRSAGSRLAWPTSRRCSPKPVTPSSIADLDPDDVRQAMPAILATIEATLDVPSERLASQALRAGPRRPTGRSIARLDTLRVSGRSPPGVNPDCQQSVAHARLTT